MEKLGGKPIFFLRNLASPDATMYKLWGASTGLDATPRRLEATSPWGPLETARLQITITKNGTLTL